MTPEMMAMLMLGFIVLGIILGIPVAYILGGVPLVFGLIYFGDKILPMYYAMVFGMVRAYALVCVPLFIFMGTLLERSGIAENLYRGFF
ncbi:unnamed protein product, partial [marine sediment metagenome]